MHRVQNLSRRRVVFFARLNFFRARPFRDVPLRVVETKRVGTIRRDGNAHARAIVDRPVAGAPSRKSLDAPRPSEGRDPRVARIRQIFEEGVVVSKLAEPEWSGRARRREVFRFFKGREAITIASLLRKPFAEGVRVLPRDENDRLPRRRKEPAAFAGAELNEIRVLDSRVKIRIEGAILLVRDLRRPNAEIRAGDRDEFKIDLVVQRDLFHAAFFVGRRAFVDGEGRLGTQRAGETRANRRIRHRGRRGVLFVEGRLVVLRRIKGRVKGTQLFAAAPLGFDERGVVDAERVPPVSDVRGVEVDPGVEGSP